MIFPIVKMTNVFPSATNEQSLINDHLSTVQESEENKAMYRLI